MAQVKKVILDIVDTGWSTTKLWRNLLPYVACDAGIDMKVMIGRSLECQCLRTLLQNENISCKQRFPWRDFRPARIRWKIEDMLAVYHGWMGATNVFHSSTTRIPVFGSWKKCITIHDTIRELFPDEFGAANQSILQMRKNAVKRCDGILTISEYTKKCIVSIFNIDPKKIFVCHLSANRLAFNPYRSSQVDRKLPIEPYLLYIGTRSGYKNFRVLANAISSNSYSKKLTIVAIGGGELADTEKYLLKKLGILDRIIVFNDVSEEFLQLAYKKAFAFVCPSKMEGFGMPIVEAQTAGCPVIASNTGPLPEVAGKGALFFDPDDYGKLASLIERVGEQEIRRELVQAGFTNVLRFSWKESAKNIVQMYQV